MPRGMWDLNSPTRDQTHVPCSASALTSGLPGESLCKGSKAECGVLQTVVSTNMFPEHSLVTQA